MRPGGNGGVGCGGVCGHGCGGNGGGGSEGGGGVVVVVVGAAYCTDIFPQRTHINTFLCSETCNSINGYYATNNHGTIFFLELCRSWEILLRRRSDIHDFAVCLGVGRQTFLHLKTAALAETSNPFEAINVAH